jgi:hypothetical protein
MTSESLKAGGWVAMASAFLVLPIAYLSFTLEGRTNSYSEELQTFIQASGTLIFLTIFLYLKKFLNSRFSFHATDTTIAFVVMANMVTGAVALGIYSFPALKESLASLLIIIQVVQGIVLIRFGFNLLKLPDNLGGMLNPFCYANIATGILLASVILIPLSMLASAISALMLGTIFFNAARRLSSQS